MSEEFQHYELTEPLPYIPYASPQRQPAPSMEPGEGTPDLPLPFPPPIQLSPPVPVESIVLPVPTRKRSRRGLWITLSIIAFLLLASIAAFWVSTASTPNKTLDAFCNALQHGDYRAAYNQFSHQLQDALSETTYADIFSQDKVTQCSHGIASNFGSSATTELKLVHASKGINNDLVTLIKDNNNEWKIDEVRRA